LRASEQLRATLFSGHEEQRVPLAASFGVMVGLVLAVWLWIMFEDFV
jgi:hypothetical protein